MKQLKKIKSYSEVLGSMLIFGTIGVLRKNISLSSGILAFARGIVGGLFLWIFSLIKREKVFIGKSKKQILFLIFSGGLIGLNWILLFEAYNYTSVSVATLCYYMQPTIVLLLSPLILKERLGIKKIICAVLSVVGMFAVSGVFNTGSERINIAGVLYGLGAATVYSLIVITNKAVTKHDDTIGTTSSTAIRLLFASIVLVPYLSLSGEFTNPALFSNINTRVILTVLCMCVVHTGAAYALYFCGMEGISGQTTAVLSYADPVFALVMSAVFLNEKLGLYGIIGSVLIIGSAFFSELNIFEKTRNKI